MMQEGKQEGSTECLQCKYKADKDKDKDKDKE